MNSFSNFFDDQEDNHSSRVSDFIDNMNFLKSMTVEEHTLYKKWEDLNYNFSQELSNLRIVRNKIWKPIDIFDKEVTINQIQNLKPKIELVESNNLYDWTILRNFSHTMVFDANIGRNLKFLVSDETTGKYIGVLNVASDVISITDRDNYIGWTRENRINDKKINYTAICSCILPTQPFGYNFLGGKLMAILSTSKFVRDCWKNKYNDSIIGFTTTSLYGSYSMYNGIPYWKHVGNSLGKIAIKPDDKVYNYMHNYIKKNNKDEYDRLIAANNSIGVSSGLKQRQLSLIFKEIGLTPSHYTHGYQRGVYFASIYDNSKEFLCNKIPESDLVMKKRYESDIDGMLEWWKEKAIKRYSKLHDESKLNNNVLFYDDLIGVDWNKTKELYLNQIGR